MEQITEYLKERFEISLDKQQEQAVLAEDPQILLLAVPGSGKTTVLVSRIAHRILTGKTEGKCVLTLTFSREAAKDMKRRFLTLFSEKIPLVPRFSTIHSFCYMVLEYYAKRYRRKRPELIDGQGAALLRRIYQQVNEEYLTDDMLESLVNDISLVNNLMIPREELKDYEITAPNFREILDRYEQAKKEQNLMDYDDMLFFALTILQKAPAVREAVMGRYDEIYLDEAQDTSKLQYEILNLIGKGKRLFVVGDEDQCIYSFRGAYPEGLTEFPARYPNAKVLKIEMNYRCPADLVDQANAVIELNRNRYKKKMVPASRQRDSVAVQPLEDYRDQYQHILEEIQNTAGTVAVLYRNNESAVPVVDLLEEQGVSYYCKENSQRFFSSFVVRDVTAYLNLALNPKSLPDFERICYQCYCSRMTLIYVKYNLARYDSVWEAAIDCPDTSYASRKRLVQIMEEMGRFAKKLPRQVIDLIESRLGYGDYLKKRSGTGINRINAALKLNILKTLAGRHTTVREFLSALDFLSRRLGQAEGSGKECRVTLSSVHSSKGLEFDTVILLDFIDGVLPTLQALEDADAGDREPLEGETRLFYVAVTRARKKLLIFTSSFCNDEYVTKSRFLTRFFGEAYQGKNTENAGDQSWLKGRRVVHKLFGEGVIKKAGPQDQITVRFAKGEIRELSYRVCIDSGLLTIKETGQRA
ncbi:ATP-dependent helicase [Massilimaliae timonensis]|uniref:DNA 3'-5' helicase n=1 Tax=Massiliimalia timonensis TaxID=1987501 RepID=A0A8J6PAZ9_9FIRM|nr:ATP-dependent helicase [Massiliimalia timonensis]MBC8610013.1 ATP-dependent helicase [Massiliimalia timonensis]